HRLPKAIGAAISAVCYGFRLRWYPAFFNTCVIWFTLALAALSYLPTTLTLRGAGHNTAGGMPPSRTCTGRRTDQQPGNWPRLLKNDVMGVAQRLCASTVRQRRTQEI